MIRIDGLSKRHGRQILFLEASAVLGRGEKIGLVGPNGSGKTTIFRLITGEEEPDAGQIAVDRGVAIGYFSQDIGEMKGQSVVEAALDGAGPAVTGSGSDFCDERVGRIHLVGNLRQRSSTLAVHCDPFRLLAIAASILFAVSFAAAALR